MNAAVLGELVSHDTWIDVSAFADLPVNRGVCCLVAGEQVALYRLAPDETVFALSNRDPFSGAFVMSRGLIGSRTVDGAVRRMVTSPMYKQAFDLETGVCLDDPTNSVAAYGARLLEGRVFVSAQPVTGLVAEHSGGS